MAKTHAIQPGCCVAVHLMPDTAPDDCYIGIVDVVDEHGIVINLVHWDDKLDMPGGYTESIFIPWVNINSILLSAKPTRRFLADKARKWKMRIEAMHEIDNLLTKKRPSSK